MNAHDLVQEIIERKGKIENVFWIACGGSMIDLMPANELLKREATTFTSTVYTAREFCLMAPKSLGEKSLVIACSHSGNTQEVVDGCEMALAAGAEVVALTDCERTKIDNGKWTTWVYPWGEGVPQAEVPQGIGALIAAELLDQQEGYEALADMYEGLKQMDALLPAARENGQRRAGRPLCRGSVSSTSSSYSWAGARLARPTQWPSARSWRCSGRLLLYSLRRVLPRPVRSHRLRRVLLVPLPRIRRVPPHGGARARRSSTRTPTRSWCSTRLSTAWARCLPTCVRSWSRSSSNMSCELRAARGKVFDHSPEVRRYMGIEQY